jgi:ATP-binding cassette subfamily B protein
MTKKSVQNDYLRTILGYLSRYRMLALPGLAVMILIALGQLAGPYILKQIIDVAVPKENTGLLLTYAFAFLGIVSVTGLLSYVGMMLLARLGLSIVTLIKQDLFSHLLKLPMSFFDKHPVGELMSRTETDTERVRDMFSNLGANLIVNVLTMIGIFVVTFVLVPRLALIMAGVSVLLLTFLIVFFSKIFSMYEKARSFYAAIVAKVTEFIQGIEVLKAYGRTGWAEAELDVGAKQRVSLEVRISLIEYTMMSVLESLIGPLFIVALLLLYAPKVLTGTMTLGMILLFVEYGARLLRPIAEIAESLRSLQQARTSLSFGRSWRFLKNPTGAPANLRPSTTKSASTMCGSRTRAKSGFSATSRLSYRKAASPPSSARAVQESPRLSASSADSPIPRRAISSSTGYPSTK